MTCEKRPLKETVQGSQPRPGLSQLWTREGAGPLQASVSLVSGESLLLWREKPEAHTHTHTHTHVKDTAVTGTHRQQTPCLHVVGLLTGLGLSFKERTASHTHRAGCQLTVNQRDSPPFPVSATKKHAHLSFPWAISEEAARPSPGYYTTLSSRKMSQTHCLPVCFFCYNFI